jgi:hypothetical protein
VGGVIVSASNLFLEGLRSRRDRRGRFDGPRTRNCSRPQTASSGFKDTFCRSPDKTNS